MPSVPQMLAPFHRRFILRRLIVGALLGAGCASTLWLCFAIYRLVASCEGSFSGYWIALAASAGLLSAWFTRPSLFQTALHLDQTNQTHELFSTALKMDGDREFVLAVQAIAAGAVGKLKPEPFVMLKRLGPAVVLILAMSIALSIWPVSPQTASTAIAGAASRAGRDESTGISVFHPADPRPAPSAESEMPGESLFAPQPLAGRGYSASDPTQTEHAPVGFVPRVETGVGNARGFATSDRIGLPEHWRGGLKLSEGDFGDSQKFPAEYREILARYFSPSGL